MEIPANVDYLKFLCRQMVERCDEYQALKDSPDLQSTAAALRDEIIRLYAEISMLRQGTGEVARMRIPNRSFEMVCNH